MKKRVILATALFYVLVACSQLRSEPISKMALLTPSSSGTYSITELPANFGSYHISALSNSGQVVGYCDTGNFIHAAMWDKNSGLHDLGTFDQNYDTYASGINDNGQIVGVAYLRGGDPTKNNFEKYFSWDNINGFRDLGFSSTWSMLPKINNHGQIIAKNQGQTILLNTDGSIINIGPDGQLRSATPRGINDAGQVVGLGNNGHGLCSFLWDDDTLRMINIDSLGGSSGNGAFDLNNQGQVVGMAPTQLSCNNAYIWEDGEMSMLVPQAQESWAKAINDNGQVVGYYNNGIGDVGFIWENGVMTELANVVDLSQWETQDLKYTIYGLDINNNGQILVEVFSTPEPATLLLLGLGAIVVTRK